jgi:hypothetical protein
MVVTVDPFAPGAPCLPDLCRVYGFEYLNGSPVAGRAVNAELVDLPKVSASIIFEGSDAETTTDGGGYWYLDLVRGLSYSFRIQEAGILRMLAVPDEASVDLRTLL